ncbi:hypothetical protein Tco_1306993, partial [Tanacetum coccineum]
NSLLPTELKDLPSKFNELTEKVKGLKKQVHELEFELPGDKSVPLVGQADTMPAEGEKNINQATISQLF